MVASAFFFSLMSLQVKAVGGRIPSQEVVLARNLATLVFTYAMLRARGLAPWGTHRRLLFARGFFGYLGLSCWFYSLPRLPLAEATIIQYTNPIFTALIAAVVLKEAVGARLVVAIGLSFAGVLLVTRPSAATGGVGTQLDPATVLIALVGAVFAAAAYVTIRRIGHREDPLVIVFYFPLVSIPLTLPAVLGSFVMPQGVEWALLLGVGVTTQIAQICLTRGIGLLPAGRATSFGYLQIVFVAIWGWLFFAEAPVRTTVVGAALIIAGTAIVALKKS